MEDFIVTIKDARAYHGGCIPGWQAFAEAHGFDWVDAVRHGLLASQLEATKDAMAIGLVDFARKRREV
jgi:hypothetical protein